MSTKIDPRFDSSDPNAVAWAEQHAADLVTSVSDTTRSRIQDAVTAAFTTDGDVGELTQDILDAVGDETRAAMIARTEVMTAANEGQRQAWSQAVTDGVLTGNEVKEWIATEGCCDDCDDLDGTTAPLDGEYEGDGGDGPPLHPNCRCTEGISAGNVAGT